MTKKVVITRMARRLLARGVICAVVALPMGVGAAKPVYNIVTGPERASLVQIGNDLSRFVAEGAGIELKVLTSAGSVENIRRLRDERGTKLAIMHSDVYEAYRSMAMRGNAEAARVISPLRVVVPLFESDVHFVVRADSPLNAVHEIRGQRINIGPLGSGSAMTAATLYRLMFNADMDDANVSTMSHEDALRKLVTDKSVDVVAVISGQPVPLFLGMEPGVEKYFKLLKLDVSHPSFARARGTYDRSAIKAESYPAWLSADVPSLSVKTFLVTYNYELQDTRDMMARFARSLCENFPTLQREGHPKWRQVSLQLPELGEGWRYYAPTQQALANCQKVRPRSVQVCSLQERVAGMCAQP